MALTKQNILDFVNSKLHTSETDIDSEIQEVLDDLSDANLLMASEAVADLAAASTTIVRPTLFKQLVTIVLDDGTSNPRPLWALPGGQPELRRALRYSPSQGTPEWFTEFGLLFYIYPISDGVYTPTIEYFKFHAGADEETGADAIEFGNEFSTTIKQGAAFNVATKKRMAEQMVLWGQKYQISKQKRIDDRIIPVYISGGPDGT